MTRLAANPKHKLELARRKLKARVEEMRARIEAERDPALSRMVDKAETHLLHHRLTECDEGLTDLADDLIQRDQDREDKRIAAGIKEQERLLAERGIETVTGKGEGLARDGFQWLLKKGRLSVEREATGHTLRRLYDEVWRDGLSSSANDNGANGEEGYCPVAERMKAAEKLQWVRSHIGNACGHAGPAELLDAVCGRGDTLRSLAANDDRVATVSEGQFLLALDMAGIALRNYRTATPCGFQRTAA